MYTPQEIDSFKQQYSKLKAIVEPIIKQEAEEAKLKREQEAAEKKRKADEVALAARQVALAEIAELVKSFEANLDKIQDLCKKNKLSVPYDNDSIGMDGTFTQYGFDNNWASSSC